MASYYNYTFERTGVERLDKIDLKEYFHTDDTDNIPPITIKCAINLLDKLCEKYKTCIIMQIEESLKYLCLFLFGTLLEFNQKTQNNLNDVLIKCENEIKRVEEAFYDNVRLKKKEKLKNVYIR